MLGSGLAWLASTCCRTVRRRRTIAGASRTANRRHPSRSRTVARVQILDLCPECGGPRVDSENGEVCSPRSPQVLAVLLADLANAGRGHSAQRLHEELYAALLAHGELICPRCRGPAEPLFNAYLDARGLYPRRPDARLLGLLAEAEELARVGQFDGGVFQRLQTLVGGASQA